MTHLTLGVFGMAVGVTALLLAPVPGLANDDRDRDRDDSFHAKLKGFSEAPAVFSTGSGRFKATVNDDDSMITFELRYSDLEGNVTVAHIHFGQPDVSGGVSAFLCGGGGKPACPPSPATVTGTIVAADVVGPAGQGIAASELNELLRAMRRGMTYVNVHSDKHASGEIRGNIP
jgi:hypothetical protein